MRALLSICAALVLIVLWSPVAVAQTEDEDRGFIAGLLEDALGGPGRTVRVIGFSGALSATAKVEQITIADDEGTWLSMEDIELTWSRAALLRGRIDVDLLKAQRIALDRFPVPGPSSPPTAESGGFSLPELPVSIEISEVVANRIDLGESILGSAASFRLQAAATLVDGAADLSLSASRIDGRQGDFRLAAAYANETEIAKIDLSLEEAPDGLAARGLKLPGLPSVSLDLQGEGPLDDFSAALRLATDGAERLRGRIVLAGVTEPEPARRFTVDIGGDVTALFIPDFRPFFGEEVALVAEGARSDDGAITLERFQLRAESLNLDGAAALSPDGWPQSFDVSGRIANRDGSDVVLPVSGAETRVRSADLALRFDAAQGERWEGRIAAQGFRRDGIGLDRLGLDGSGTITVSPDRLGSVTAAVVLSSSGLRLPDEDLSGAIGEALGGRLVARYDEGGPLVLETLSLEGPSYALDGTARFSGLDAAFRTEFDLRLKSPDVTFLSRLAERDLRGGVNLRLSGSADAGGAFDIAAEGSGRDLAVGSDVADRLLAGPTSLRIAAERSETGLRLKVARVENPQIQLMASGQLDSRTGKIDFDTRIAETRLIADPLRGPLSVAGQLVMADETWRITSDAQGPFGSTLTVQGRVAPAPIVTYDFAMPDVAPIAPGFAGPLRLQGRVKTLDGVITTDTALAGPAGTTGTLVGDLSPQLDLALEGTAPLGLVSPFIEPRSIKGQVRFDLRAAGPTPDAISGEIGISSANLVLPAEGITLEQIGGTMNLRNGQAALAFDGRSSEGGRLNLQGGIGLGAGFPADLRINLDRFVLEDPTLYRTSLDGSIDISGPLQGGGRISGNIRVGETLITLSAAPIGSVARIPEMQHIGAPAEVLRSQQRAGLGSKAEGNGNGGPVFGLDLSIRAPNRIFVRGRGLDAELGGSLRVTGTTRDTISAGAFELIRGRLNILAKRFVLDEGRISLQGKLDPSVNFRASTNTEEGTASVIIEGFISDPEVRFEATPAVPEDEVLAQILFGRDISQLSPFQALQLADAVASLVGGQGSGLMSRVREGFALDDLDVQSDEAGNTGVRLGKYLSDNVYTDVIVGKNEEAGVSINVDLNPRVTVRGQTTAVGDTSVGIFFERNY